MAQFQFKEGLILDFGGVQYEVHPDDPDFLQTFNEQCEHFDRMGSEIQAIESEKPVEGIQKACSILIDAIDQILGDGAVAEIFSDRAIGFYDLMDVFRYIAQETKEYRERRHAEVVPAPQNREQRRAAAKTAKSSARSVKLSPVGEHA